LSLHTEHEWEKAAYGNTGFDYPWGNSIFSVDLRISNKEEAMGDKGGKKDKEKAKKQKKVKQNKKAKQKQDKQVKKTL